MCIYIYVYLCIYIYIYIERERDLNSNNASKNNKIIVIIKKIEEGTLKGQVLWGPGKVSGFFEHPGGLRN